MVFIQHSSREYNELRREMEDDTSKGRDEYSKTVTLTYNLMLEWQPEPGSMQGGAIQRNNNLEFAQQNE